MPRISPSLARKAIAKSSLLPRLLRANRTLEAAEQELRWIQQELPQQQWKNAVLRRSRLEPLQYILKSQPFGPLDIICRSGVLIPRWETEEWTYKVANALAKLGKEKQLNIVDACTGTGCIPLLLTHELYEQEGIPVDVVAFDVSDEAFKLASENLNEYSNIYKSGKYITIKQADLFSNDLVKELGVRKESDLVTSNPPYIPHEDYISSVSCNGTSRSVRIYEPSLALIGENEFYGALLEQLVIPTNSKGFIFELGYTYQANYVRDKLRNMESWKIGTSMDGAGRIRCVVGWQKGSEMEILEEVCDEVLD
ncbi:S-adenosyl-L-methionine-dependent methyltransferase [Scheffersomyces xylosifermentans]|uniref:S-adenosyl-L-methionine-dependent methyltransferase n=1 Tax=Scheffersomyces xylosifermentans TaxID=1304137 RepID=UPI00315CA107